MTSFNGNNLPKRVNTNGNGWSKTLIAGAITLVLACMGGAFAFGSHVGNRDIHQSREEDQVQTQKTVDRAVDRELKPMFQDLQRRLTDVEKELRELKKEH